MQGMKIFAMFARVTLSRKPEWLDEFRKKFDEPCELHVTLVQPRYIEVENVERLQKEAGRFFSSIATSPRVYFDEIVSGPDTDGITIMIGSRNAPALVAFQKDLCGLFAPYGQYTKPEYEGYEKNFWPHLTIGRKLSEEQFQEASGYLKEGVVCEGAVEEVVLAIVDEQTVEQANNPANRTLYSLE